MSEEKAKIPAIRFKGFTDAWEQRKLGDIFTEYSEKHHRDMPALMVVQGEGTVFRAESDRVIQFDESNLDSYKLVNEGDFIVHLRSFEGGLERSGLTGIVSPAYHIFRGENVDGNFYYSYFRSGKFILHDLTPHVYGIRDGRSIDIAGMKTISIPWAVREEQNDIGKSISTFDRLITLHQRKLDLLKDMKKTLLSMLFPKNGSSIPEARFAGFTDAWEQRKLGDVTERVTRKNSGLESDLPLTISAQYGLIDQREFFDRRVASKDISGYYLIKRGEFAYNKSTSADAEWGTIKRLDSYDAGVLSTLYIVFSVKPGQVSSDFLAVFYETNRWHQDIGAIAAEGARNHGLLNISPADFFNTFISSPADRTEQMNIGRIFGGVDRLITLHQRKLDILKDMKKTLLKEMFV